MDEVILISPLSEDATSRRQVKVRRWPLVGLVVGLVAFAGIAVVMVTRSQLTSDAVEPNLFRRAEEIELYLPESAVEKNCTDHAATYHYDSSNGYATVQFWNLQTCMIRPIAENEGAVQYSEFASTFDLEEAYGPVLSDRTKELCSGRMVMFKSRYLAAR